jgi:hypothetical protein
MGKQRTRGMDEIYFYTAQKSNYYFLIFAQCLQNVKIAGIKI